MRARCDPGRPWMGPNNEYAMTCALHINGKKKIPNNIIINYYYHANAYQIPFRFPFSPLFSNYVLGNCVIFEIAFQCLF